MNIQHLAIIPDGNRRWARSRVLPTLEGHRRGYENFKTIAKAAYERGITYMTFWAFSTENWKRSQEEVDYLMDLLLTMLKNDRDFLIKEKIQLKVIGRKSELSQEIQEAIKETEAATAAFSDRVLQVGINYGGRAEIVDAVKSLIASGAAESQITEELIRSQLWTGNAPDPDVIVRTSGEQRLSGFLSWVGGYSELIFVENHWPAFSEDDLVFVIEEFSRRDRRFGGDGKSK